VTIFSKFRMFLLFISFYIIIYVTLRARKNPKENKMDDKAIKEDLLKQIAKMKKNLD